MSFPDLMTHAARYIENNPATFSEACYIHLFMSLCSVALAGLLAIPLGFLCARHGAFSARISGLFNGLRVLPGLAILALMIPVLGTGLLPTVLALVLLAFPSILLNTIAGSRQVGRDVRETAHALGMSERQLFLKVEFPLAAPSVLNGLRIASVEVISGATLGAFIGGGGLGTFIVNGLSTYDFSLLMVGALPVALMAMLVEIGFAQLTRQATRYQRC